MDLSKLREPLSIEKIDFRIQSINNGGYATILAYKDARVDMERLDNVVGCGFWQRRHEFKNNKLYCSVGIYNEKIGQFVWVEDVGTESNAEAEKGQASDSFKRACFNLGIGRELYDYPQISIKLFDEETQNYNGKLRPSFKLRIKAWHWESEFIQGKIARLKAVDDSGRVRFNWSSNACAQQDKEKALSQAIKPFMQQMEEASDMEGLKKAFAVAYKMTDGTQLQKEVRGKYQNLKEKFEAQNEQD